MKVSCHYDERDTPSFVSRLQSMEYTTDSAMSSCRVEGEKKQMEMEQWVNRDWDGKSREDDSERKMHSSRQSV